MQERIRPSELRPLSPDDRLTFGPRVLDFWQWAMSDLRMNNVRGYLAEFMVATATGSPTPARVEWAPFDVLTGDRTRVEVKATGYLQSWTNTTPTRPRWTFKSVDADRYWDEEKAVMVNVSPRDRVDVWVFALQTCQQAEQYDPLDVGQWEFRVVPHRELLKLDQRSVGPGSLDSGPIQASPVSFEELGQAVKRAAAVNALA